MQMATIEGGGWQPVFCEKSSEYSLYFILPVLSWCRNMVYLIMPWLFCINMTMDGG